MKNFSLATLLISTFFLNGCAAFLSATNDDEIDLDPNKRTFGTRIDDSQLETIAKVNIGKASEELKKAPISVTSYNYVILLTGQVQSNELRELAGATVAKIDKVRKVHNELEVMAPITVLATSSDAWLTTKVKTRLINDKNVRGGRLKVITENDVVYLMGMIPRVEAEKAAEIARTTTGVQKVVLAVEYTQ